MTLITHWNPANRSRDSRPGLLMQSRPAEISEQATNTRTVRRLLLFLPLTMLVACTHLSEKHQGTRYLRDVAQWQEVAMPAKSDQAAWMVWSYAASYSRHEWRVFIKDGLVNAQLCDEAPEKRPNRPNFTPKAGTLRGPSAFAAVDDGWLVAFNHGEFGAALYWFSQNGERSYKISGHHIVDFFSFQNGVYAIEGLEHMGISKGSVIRIDRPTGGTRWQTASVAELHFAPYAVSLRRDGNMLITLSDSLVSVGIAGKIQTLLAEADAPWGGLYPNSSVLSPDEQKLYIGMRQFVAEFDLTTKGFRLLVPSTEFLNKLPHDDERRIRKQYGGP